MGEDRAARRRRERAETKYPPRARRSAEPALDPMFLAGVEMIRRSGAIEFQIRHQDDEDPTVWIAIAHIKHPEADGWEAAAALHPTAAVLRLCAELVDGGKCVHCGRPTGFTEDFDGMPSEATICWYAYDPELRTFRRGCADGLDPDTTA